jgi:hypothetical protein
MTVMTDERGHTILFALVAGPLAEGAEHGADDLYIMLSSYVSARMRQQTSSFSSSSSLSLPLSPPLSLPLSPSLTPSHTLSHPIYLLLFSLGFFSLITLM